LFFTGWLRWTAYLALASYISLAVVGCSVSAPTEDSQKEATFLRADSVFFRALDLGEGQPLANRIQVLQRVYVDGTSTLVDSYVRNRLGGGDIRTGLEALLQYVDQNPSFYDEVRRYFDSTDPIPPVRQAIQNLVSMTRRSAETQVIFFVGAHRVNAFIDNQLVGIAVEWFLPVASPANALLDSTVQESLQRAGGFQRMPIWGAHEYTHLLVRLPLRTVFDFVIEEGIAVQASELAVPGRPMQEYLGYTAAELDWALSHEAEIWRDLLDVMNSEDTELIRSYVSADGRPYADGPGRIGYFIGYRVAQSYLKVWGGLRALVAETSPMTILDRSGYTP
jgi:hypothetical protein